MLSVRLVIHKYIEAVYQRWNEEITKALAISAFVWTKEAEKIWCPRFEICPSYPCLY